MTARGDRKRAAVRAEILAQVRPEGCEGGLGITTKLTKETARNGMSTGTHYKLTFGIGCAGLSGGMAEGASAEAHSYKTPSPRVQHGIENAALLGAGAAFNAICVSCPLGTQGARARDAQALAACEGDDLGKRLEIAQADLAKAEAEARAAEATLALAKLGQRPALEVADVPADGAPAESTLLPASPAADSQPPTAN